MATRCPSLPEAAARGSATIALALTTAAYVRAFGDRAIGVLLTGLTILVIENVKSILMRVSAWPVQASDLRSVVSTGPGYARLRNTTTAQRQAPAPAAKD